MLPDICVRSYESSCAGYWSDNLVLNLECVLEFWTCDVKVAICVRIQSINERMQVRKLCI